MLGPSAAECPPVSVQSYLNTVTTAPLTLWPLTHTRCFISLFLPAAAVSLQPELSSSVLFVSLGVFFLNYLFLTESPPAHLVLVFNIISFSVNHLKMCSLATAAQKQCMLVCTCAKGSQTLQMFVQNLHKQVLGQNAPTLRTALVVRNHSGAPQGPVLGPLFLSFYEKDLPDSCFQIR